MTCFTVCHSLFTARTSWRCSKDLRSNLRNKLLPHSSSSNPDKRMQPRQHPQNITRFTSYCFCSEPLWDRNDQCIIIKLITHDENGFTLSYSPLCYRVAFLSPEPLTVVPDVVVCNGPASGSRSSRLRRSLSLPLTCWLITIIVASLGLLHTLISRS